MDRIVSEIIGPPQQRFDTVRNARMDIDDRLKRDIEYLKIVMIKGVKVFHA
jgi:hypothetical protein